MRVGLTLLLCFAAFDLCAAVSAQDWNAGSTTDYLIVQRDQQGYAYTFTFKNPAVSDKDYTVLGWTVEPFNVAVPVSVVCPDGWEWVDRNGWKQFRVADWDARYDVGGPALEPGESLTFTYTIGENSTPVNPGGPEESGVAFLSQVAAVDGSQDGAWTPAVRDGDQVWYDTPKTPEASPRMVLISAFCALACLIRKRARV